MVNLVLTKIGAPGAQIWAWCLLEDILAVVACGGCCLELSTTDVGCPFVLATFQFIGHILLTNSSYSKYLKNIKNSIHNIIC